MQDSIQNWGVFIVNKLIILARLFLFFLSCYGYIQYLHKSVRLEFCIGLLFSFIGSVLFLAGILNLLRPAVWILFLIGLLLFGYSVKQKQSLSDMLCPGILFFILLSVFLFFTLYGCKLVHYDNFTHWARATRALISNHRFPSFQEPYIKYASYPLGSAVFIYYFAEITGLTYEWAQMFAQSMLLLSMITGLFSFVKGVFPSLLVAFFCLFLVYSSSSSIRNLYVDSLLALVASNSVAFCAYYGKDLKNRLQYLLPYAVFLMNIKNSALLFVILLLFYVWLSLRKERISAKWWIYLLAVPMMTFVLWKAHVTMVFSSDMLGPHSLSISLFSRNIHEKHLADIQIILSQFAQKCFSLSNHALWVLLTGFLLCIFSKLSVPQGMYQEIATLYLFSVISYLLYQLGAIGMYLFSMYRLEALRLASYDRYHSTIVSFISVLLLLISVKQYSVPHTSRTRDYLAACLMLCTLIVSYFALSPRYFSYQSLRYDGTDRHKLDQLISEYDIKPGKSYLILVKDTDAGFVYYMSQYVLESQDVTVATEEEIAYINPFGLNVAYIIVFDESDKAADFLTKLSDGFSDPVFCLY